MILDADLTVPPEDLPRFYDALARGKGEFVNGVRLVYPMEKQRDAVLQSARQQVLQLGVLLAAGPADQGHAVRHQGAAAGAITSEIAANRAYFGDFDPFGDFDLLFGAARLNLKMIDMPIRYRDRTYGQTNIQRWKHGWLLLKMVAFAASRIKFI